ncbi:MAG TPA: hypothetical protein VFZ89_03050, partial [Solirubrobacteraceae bacterium]
MRFALATAAALLALAAPAAAAPVWQPDSVASGLFATPDGVAWVKAEDRSESGEMDTTTEHRETLYVVRPGGRPSAVSFGAAIRTPTFSNTTEDAFVAGDFAVKLTSSRGGVPGVAESSTQSADVYDLVRRTPVTQVCGFHAAGASVLAYERCGAGVVVRDNATGAESKAPVSSGIVAVAGRFLAARGADKRVRVYDWTTGAERYSAELPAGVVALASDGTVVVNADFSACDVNHLVAASIADPAPRTLPLPACSGWLAISGSRLVFKTRNGYAVAALDGSGARSLVTPRDEVAEGHVNGDALAYAADGCDAKVALYRVSLTQPEAPVSTCAGTATRARLTARHVHVTLRCPEGCLARLQVRPIGRAALPDRAVRVRGGTRTFALRVGPVTRRRIARAGKVQVTLTTFALDSAMTTVTRTLRLR